jgi:hypothetical protein
MVFGCPFAPTSLPPAVAISAGVHRGPSTALTGPALSALIMELPNADKAEISQAKIVSYLLSLKHWAGRSKAAFFRKHGFTPEDWRGFAEALGRHAVENAVTSTTKTAYGTRYVVDGPLAAPDGTSLNVRSVWFISEKGVVPRFATAHPLRRKSR